MISRKYIIPPLCWKNPLTKGMFWHIQPKASPLWHDCFLQMPSVLNSLKTLGFPHSRQMCQLYSYYQENNLRLNMWPYASSSCLESMWALVQISKTHVKTRQDRQPCLKSQGSYIKMEKQRKKALNLLPQLAWPPSQKNSKGDPVSDKEEGKDHIQYCSLTRTCTAWHTCACIHTAKHACPHTHAWNSPRVEKL